MRLCLFCLLLCASLGAQPAPDSAADTAARTARVEGQVLSQAGEPLRKATLRLAPYYADRGSNISYTDTTDGAGKFVLEGVLPGRYTLSAERTGFLAQKYGARSTANSSPGSVLSLAAGQSLKDLDFKLIPQGVITGRVTDADGDPMPGLQVFAMQMYRMRGQRGLAPKASAQTDDQGSFRIAGLAPGDYYINAWEELDVYLSFDLDFLKRFASPETTITLEQSAHQTVQPKLISREEAAAEAAKLP